ncbi:MAG: hypothetical protein M3Y82_02485 [Verrucomicrobiota bacterium]|nr:hypothetical protein [Verrucomicrobiota bacterium]
MRGVKLFFIFWAGWILLAENIQSGTYILTDGKTVSGDPIAADENGVVLKSSSGAFLPRTPWIKLSADSLKIISAEKPQFAQFINPLLEEELPPAVEKKEMVIKRVERPERPTGRIGLFALFVSPLGWLIFLILYAANIYAAYEIAAFKKEPARLVCGVAAVAPLIGPIIFLCLPSKYVVHAIEETASSEAETTAENPETISEENILVEETAPPIAPVSVQPQTPLAPAVVERPKLQPTLKLAAHEPPAPVAATPPVVTFRRGEFSFNRRFFETKMPGFFRIVPSEAEKDLVIYCKAARGEFVGKRIARINQTELYLQVFKEGVSSEEMIPFTEIQEVQIRHKDAA